MSLRLVAFPFHDRRKADVQGVRWRDGHLVEALARHPEVERILIVDRPTSRIERAIRRQPARAVGTLVAERRAGRATATLVEVAPRIVALDVEVPDVLGPALRGRGWWFDVFEREDVLELLAWGVQATVGGGAPVVAWTPTVAAAIESLMPSRVLFDSLDNWITHPLLRQHAARAGAAYGRLLPRADVVLVSAPRSKEVLSAWATGIEVMPNGVDPALFAAPQPRPADLPAAPLVGYAGTMGPRLDEDLIVDVARRLPGVSFCFIGQDPRRRLVDVVRGGIPGSRPGRHRPSLRNEPNIHVLGDRHYTLVPAYVQAFDVAWIPHAVGEGESGGDPIKMYEYWAAGREVVATRIDGLDAWSDRLHLVDDAAGAATVIAGLLDGSVSPKWATVPAERTWDAMAGRLVEFLQAS